jgi:hypothetical protein
MYIDEWLFYMYSRFFRVSCILAFRRFQKTDNRCEENKMYQTMNKDKGVKKEFSPSPNFPRHCFLNSQFKEKLKYRLDS